MRCSIFGVQEVNFVTSDGKPIKGQSIYCGFENRYVDGLKTNKFFVPSDLGVQLKPDIDVEILFDMKGKIDKVEIYD